MLFNIRFDKELIHEAGWMTFGLIFSEKAKNTNRMDNFVSTERRYFFVRSLDLYLLASCTYRFVRLCN